MGWLRPAAGAKEHSDCWREGYRAYRRAGSGQGLEALHGCCPQWSTDRAIPTTCQHRRQDRAYFAAEQLRCQPNTVGKPEFFERAAFADPFEDEFGDIAAAVEQSATCVNAAEQHQPAAAQSTAVKSTTAESTTAESTAGGCSWPASAFGLAVVAFTVVARQPAY